MIIRRIVFWLSISILILLIVIPLTLNLLSIEFVNEKFELSFLNLRFWGIPICILLTLFGINEKSDILPRVVLTILAAFFSFFIMIMTALSGMCDWSDRKALFVNNETPRMKIVKRDYGCGAVDSGPPIVDTFIVQTHFKYLKKYKKVNVNQIDISEWTKVE